VPEDMSIDPNKLTMLGNYLMELGEVVEAFMYPDSTNPFTGEPNRTDDFKHFEHLNYAHLTELRNCIEDLQNLQWSGTYKSDPLFISRSLSLINRIRELYQAEKEVFEGDDSFHRFYEECELLFSYLDEYAKKRS